MHIICLEEASIDTVISKFIRGFNNGYLLVQHESDLFPIFCYQKKH